MVICPNCGKRIFDDNKCDYCKYPLKKRENPYDTEKYQYLKDEYLILNNKVDAIKNGMNEFGLSMQEAKEIVDFIADEIYEEKNYRSKEQIAKLLDEDEPQAVREKRDEYNTRMYKSQRKARSIFPIMSAVFACLLIKAHFAFESRIPVMICFIAFMFSMLGYVYGLVPKKPRMKDYYTFSFKAYFIRSLLYQIIAEAFLAWSIKLCQSHGIINKYPVVLFVWCILELILAIYIFGQLLINSTISFLAEPGKFTYSYQFPALSGSNIHKRNKRNAVHYWIDSITAVEENLNSFVIYGTITESKGIIGGSGSKRHTTARVKKIKVPKYFRNNEELIEKIKRKG